MPMPTFCPVPKPNASSALRRASVSRMASAARTALLRVVGDIDRGVPEGHDRVADELVERAFVGDDMAAQRVEKGVQKPHDGGRRQPLADLGEVSDVDEHHRQFAVVAAEAQCVPCMLDAIEQRWREILAEGPPDLAALPVGHQKAERGCREMRDRCR